MNEVVWMTPLILMPGVSLLILSTAARFGQIKGELDRPVADGKQGLRLIDIIWRRALLFRRSLICLYGAIVLFTLASLLGGILEVISSPSGTVVIAMTCLGIALVVVAALMLVLETRLMYTTLQIRHEIVCAHALSQPAETAKRHPME